MSKYLIIYMTSLDSSISITYGETTPTSVFMLQSPLVNMPCYNGHNGRALSYHILSTVRVHSHQLQASISQ